MDTIDFEKFELLTEEEQMAITSKWTDEDWGDYYKFMGTVTIDDFFGLKEARDVPTARYSINLAPNEVRCEVRESTSHPAYQRHATGIQLVAYLRHALSHGTATHPTQQSCTGFIGCRASCTTRGLPLSVCLRVKLRVKYEKTERKVESRDAIHRVSP